MPSTIYLVRHAESAHNISKDFSHRDPPLTNLGITQASTLAKSLPNLASVAVVLTSPFTRTLETTLTAFIPILDKQFVGKGGIDGGARLVLDPDLQERSALPCDTSSDRATLEKKFPNLNFGVLGDNWYAKDGAYAPHDAAVEARAKEVRVKLCHLVEKLEQEFVLTVHPHSENRCLLSVEHKVYMLGCFGISRQGLKAGGRGLKKSMFNLTAESNIEGALQPFLRGVVKEDIYT